MNEIEKLLKGVVYGSVGAVASVLEVGGEIARTFVEKGQEAVRQGQECAEEMAKTFVEKGQETVRQGQECAEGVAKAVKEAFDSMMSDPGIDVTGLNRAQRDELRRRLDEMDAAEEATAAAEAAKPEAPEAEACQCAEEPAAEEPLSAEPVEIPVADGQSDTYTVGYDEDDPEDHG